MTVEERITNLENANRQWRRLTVGMVLLVAFLGYDYATRAKPDTLRLRKLEIVDEQGTTLATFGTFEGAAMLNLFGTTGKGRITMGAGEGGSDGAQINVYNPLGKKVVSVQSDKTNEGAVHVSDVNGKITNGLTTTSP